MSSSSTSSTDPTTGNGASSASSASSASMSNDQVAEQIRMMAEELAKSRQENAKLTTERDDLAQQASRLGKAHEKEREELVNNHVKKLFNRVMDKFNTKIAPYSEQLDQITENMIKNESAMGLTQVLASASTMMEDSFNKVEEAYQREKAMKEEMLEAQKKAEADRIELMKKQEELVRTIRNISGGSFAEFDQRFNKEQGEQKDVGDKSVDTVMARASLYFDTGHNVVDSLVGDQSELQGSKRFRVNDFVHEGNADIFANLSKFKGSHNVPVTDFLQKQTRI